MAFILLTRYQFDHVFSTDNVLSHFLKTALKESLLIIKAIFSDTFF